MIRILFLLAVSASVCAAQIPAVSENFDGGEVSENFCKYFHVGNTRTRVENGRMILDYSDADGEWLMALRFPKSGQAPLNGKAFKVSFDFEVLAKNGEGRHWTAAIQRKKNGEILNDDVAYFGRTVGDKGKVVLFSNPVSPLENGAVFITPRKTKGVLAIDNFKVEECKSPEWLTDKLGKPIWGMRVLPAAGSFLAQNPQLFDIPRDKFYPFIDKFGQFKHKEWPGKAHSIEELKQRAAEEADFYKNIGEIPNRDKYFGYVNGKYKFKATGRFRTEKVGGKWFLITPEGNLFWSMGVNAAGLYQGTPVSKREHYFDDVKDKKYRRYSKNTRHIFKEPYHTFTFELRNLDWKYGKDWRKTYCQTADTRAKMWGLNTFGCWTQMFIAQNCAAPFVWNVNAHSKRTVVSKAKLVAYWRDVPDYFEPAFRQRTMELLAKQKGIISRPNCIGVFIDNELPWQAEPLTLARGILRAVPDQPAKIKFSEILKGKYGEIGALNAAWNANYKDWQGFLDADNFIPKTKAARADMMNFEELFYREYFSACRDAVKAADPGALYLGCRFAWCNELVRRVAADYCDAVSYNWYSEDARGLAHPKGSADKPIIIGEYHFGNQDRGVFGGGLRPCATMAERVERNKKYIQTALSNPNVVGAHWFRWADQTTAGRQSDGENYCCGLVDICDTPVYDFVMSVRAISRQMYETRLNGEK